MNTIPMPSINKHRRWVAIAVLLCIGFFHATVAFSACLPSAGPSLIQAVENGLESPAGDAENTIIQISNLVCKAHCEAENSQIASAVPVAFVGASVLYVVPASERLDILHAQQHDLYGIALAAPDPVYLLSARLRV